LLELRAALANRRDRDERGGEQRAGQSSLFFSGEGTVKAR
jgi:hypothetical protein